MVIFEARAFFLRRAFSIGIGRHTPGRPNAKALGYQPAFIAGPVRPKAEALGYLEAKAVALKRFVRFQNA
jgi:hypothetical protein